MANNVDARWKLQVIRIMQFSLACFFVFFFFFLSSAGQAQKTQNLQGCSSLAFASQIVHQGHAYDFGVNSEHELIHPGTCQSHVRGLGNVDDTQGV